MTLLCRLWRGAAYRTLQMWRLLAGLLGWWPGAGVTPFCLGWDACRAAVLIEMAQERMETVDNRRRWMEEED